MTKRKSEIDIMNEKFDTVINIIDTLADQSEQVMPLAAESLRLTKRIVKTYKEAFNKGLKK